MILDDRPEQCCASSFLELLLRVFPLLLLLLLLLLLWPLWLLLV